MVDTEKTMKVLAEPLWAFPLEDYLTSGQFLQFCRDHDLEDPWKEYLELFRDIPELYGNAVIKRAFVRFLHHIFHNRPGEFPAVFALLVADFSRVVPCVLAMDDLKSGLMLLGYSREETERAFSRVNADGTGSPDTRRMAFAAVDGLNRQRRDPGRFPD
jgi:hypothetical protein